MPDTTATILCFPRQATRGRRKGPDSSRPPVVLSLDPPETTDTFTAPLLGMNPSKMLVIKYHAPGDPKPWRTEPGETVLTAPDGAMFVFATSKEDSPEWVRHIESVERRTGLKIPR